MHAIQAGKDSGDKKGQWQACEGLAAVSFLQENYEKAVHFYKAALSVLSISGQQELQHNERIVNKLADALECQFLTTKKANGVSTNRARSTKSKKSVQIDGRVPQRVGKTRPRMGNHKLIARGIDGGKEVSPHQTSDSNSSSSSSDSDTQENVSPLQGRRRLRERRSIEADIHQERTSPSKRHSVRGRNGDEIWVKDEDGQDRKAATTRGRRAYSDGNIYEEPMDGESGRSSWRQSPEILADMPRSHREAYLASVAASGANSPERYADNNIAESKACIIQ